MALFKKTRLVAVPQLDTSDTSDPRLESSCWQILFTINCILKMCCQDESKGKEARNGHLKN